MINNPKISMILALGQDGSLGMNGKLPWPVHKADMAHFREMTMGKTILMGRTTWESINSVPLHGRINVVLSKTLREAPGATVIRNVSDINGDFTVIGGLSLYEQFRDKADDIHLTVIDGEYEHDTMIHAKEFLEGFEKISEKRCKDCTFFHYKRLRS